MVDLDDSAFDDVTVVEVLDGGVDSGEEVLSSADIVDGYLLSVVSSGHRVGNSGLRNVSGVHGIVIACVRTPERNTAARTEHTQLPILLLTTV